jgi:hypothetical protein
MKTTFPVEAGAATVASGANAIEAARAGAVVGGTGGSVTTGSTGAGAVVTTGATVVGVGATVVGTSVGSGAVVGGAVVGGAVVVGGGAGVTFVVNERDDDAAPFTGASVMVTVYEPAGVWGNVRTVTVEVHSPLTQSGETVTSIWGGAEAVKHPIVSLDPRAVPLPLEPA